MPITTIAERTVYCPKCGAPMRLRKGRYGDFYGCGTYPRCDRIVNIKDADRCYEPPSKKKVIIENPSREQFDILDFVLNQSGNLAVIACPGSGKTTTNVWVGTQLNNYLGLAFNTHIKEEWEWKAGDSGTIKTTHQLGLKTCKNAFGRVRVDSAGKKVQALVWGMVDTQKHMEQEDKRALAHTVRQLVGLAKSTLSMDFDFLSNRYGVPLNGDQELAYMMSKMVLEQDKADFRTVDFGDMLWFPHIHNLQPPQFPIILADECQDFNAAQHALITKALEPGGRLVAVGDPLQSLYGFRGADTDSIPNLIERFHATTLPLPISYRCPNKIVELLQVFNPDIRAAPGAEDGEILYQSEKQVLDETGPGDMLLCRTNAPLVPPIYALIKRGVKATIRGRDIGKGLIVLVEKYEPKVSSLNELLQTLINYHDREVGRLLAADKGGQAQAINDKVETIVTLSEDCQTIEELKSKTEMIFDDRKASVVGSTVHRAKGLEAKRVVILRPDLMPHPLARKDWEMEQEQNIQYVAASRSSHTLVYAEPPRREM